MGADGSDTFTPRTLVYDVKESFGTLRQRNALYELQDNRSDPSGNLRYVVSLSGKLSGMVC